MRKTNITATDRETFDALRNPEYKNFALVSCFVNGIPSVAITAVGEEGDGEFVITPLFVKVTPDLVLTDHEGTATAVQNLTF